MNNASDANYATDILQFIKDDADRADYLGFPEPVTIPVELAKSVSVMYTTRLGGVSKGGYAACNMGGKSGEDTRYVEANRMGLRRDIGIPITLIEQVHSGVAVDIDALMRERGNVYADIAHMTRVPCDNALRLADFGANYSGDALGAQVGEEGVAADAQVSAQQRLALGIFAADCLPVLLADAQAGIVAAAHCGRKGLERGIIGAAIDAMLAQGAQREHIVATLGPCICGDCYEVGEEIAQTFDAHFPGSRTMTRFGGAGIDIALAACMALEQAGVSADRQVSSRPRIAAATQYLQDDAELAAISEPHLAPRTPMNVMCTLENPLWYSHRRATLAHSAHEGRMLALIMQG